MIGFRIALAATFVALSLVPPAEGREAPACDASTFLAAPPDSVPPLRLVLNVPATRLDVLVEGHPSRSYLVAVGTDDHRTPIGSFSIDRIVWNPWWVPPPFDWARNMKVTPPGPDNPTGRVKLFFGYYHFLHGTPDEKSIGSPASHGCVRMTNADAIELARTTHAFGSPELPPAVLDSLIDEPKRTRTIHLARPVPLTVLYQRIEVRDGDLLLHPDPYELDPIDRGEILSALAAAGLPLDVDPLLIEAALDRAEAGTVRIAVHDLRASPEE
ncbi:MAG TPA: L,D-transpeptidase [Gemmatimonadota bacterium]|nr:L,D-transpeptidase [Gemmatimonadota bacterium]